MAAGLGGAEAAAADDSPCPPPSGRQFCVTVSHTPGDVSVSSDDAPSFISYTVSVQNVDARTLTHATVTACLVAGEESAEGCTPAPSNASFSSAVPSGGFCTVDDAIAHCELGSLPSGATGTVELVALAPGQAGPFQNVVATSVDEGVNDTPSPDPNQDTITVSDLAGALPPGPTATSFVPSGTALGLSAAAGGQRGEARIPSQHDALTAELAITGAPPFVCPKGEVCRGGSWVSASIPGTFDAGLRFILRWDAGLVPSKQTTRNFALFYLACDTCELEIIRTRCSSATPAISEMPCLWNVRDLRKSGFEATFISPHNGKMH